MNLREQLLLEHSKTNSELITKWIGKNKSRFSELMQLFLHDEYRVVQRAAWVLSMVAEKAYGCGAAASCGYGTQNE